MSTPSPQRADLRFCKAFFEVRDVAGLHGRLRGLGALVLASPGRGRTWYAWTPPAEVAPVTYLLRLTPSRLVLEGPSPESVAVGWRGLDQAVRPCARALVAAGDDLQRFLPRPRRQSADRPDSWDEEYQRRVLTDFYESVRRRWLDLPHRSLAGRTPRQAADEPALRPRLEALLRRMERVEQRRRERLQRTPLSVDDLRQRLLGGTEPASPTRESLL